MSKQVFKTEIKQLLDLMIHSLYSHKEIFLRELISNASDALDKLNYLTISDEKYKAIEFQPKISINFDEKLGTITIEDNGIGMNEVDLNENLGTIAKSGTKGFLSQLSGDKQKDSNLIGQFGVGFYSSFMVANKVIVNTKKALEDKAYTWISDGNGEYEILESTQETQGTKVTLILKESEKSYASKWQLEEIVKKYSNHIQFPIFLQYQEEVTKSSEDDNKDNKKEKVFEVKNEQVNNAKAIWTLQKSELKKEDYEEFYKSLSYDKEVPLSYTHTNAEGKISYKSLFYIPATAPFDLFRVDYKSNVKLYVKRVFITDDDKELLPSYLRFVKGIIDSDDLPLNVSREILQQNKILSEIKSASVKKILQMIEGMQKDEAKYKDFYSKFGKVLKEGLYNEFENKDRLLKLIRAYSYKKEKEISFQEYVDSKIENQDCIFYAIGNNLDSLKSNPLLEKFSDYDILLFSDEVDEFIVPNIGEFEKIKFVDITSTQAQEKIKEDISEDAQNEFKDLIEVFKKLDNVESVKLTSSIQSPLALSNAEDSNAYMAQIMRQMGQAAPESKKNIEININNDLIKKINALDKEVKEKYALVLLNGAKILGGQEIKNTKEYIDLVNELLLGSSS